MKNESIDEQKPNKRGGYRPGAGRPKGSETEEQKLLRETNREMRRRIARTTDKLLNSQMQLAQGESSLYRIHYEGEGKNKKKIVEIVTNQETITQYLADELEVEDGEYYYIATKSADNRAIDSLFDRAYGKAPQSIDLTSGGEKIRGALVEFVGEDGTDTENQD